MASTHDLIQPLSEFAPVYSQFYRQSASFWALTPPEYARLLLVLGVQIDGSRTVRTTYTALAQLFGVHRTTISRLVTALSHWHGPDGSAPIPALTIAREKRNTPHGHRWAGVSLTLAAWLPIGFGERVQRAPTCNDEATQATVRSTCTTKNLDPLDFKKNSKEKDNPPPILPLEVQEEDEPTAKIPSNSQQTAYQATKLGDQEGSQDDTSVLSLPHVVEGRQLLLDIGVARNNAQALAVRHSPDVIREMIRKQRTRQNVNDFAGWIVSCLRNLPEPQAAAPKKLFIAIPEGTPPPMPANPEKEARQRFKAWLSSLPTDTQKGLETEAEAAFYRADGSQPVGDVEYRRASRKNGGALWWDFFLAWATTHNLYAENA